MFVALALTCVVFAPASPASTSIPNPILFVTQVPKPEDFTSITSTFAVAPSSVTLATAGSMAAFVPAQRAMSWQHHEEHASEHR